MANTRFDSVSFQKEVEGIHAAEKRRAKRITHVFGPTSESVQKKGVLRTALDILSRPDKYLKNLKQREVESR